MSSQWPRAESVLVLVNPHTASHNTRCSSGSSTEKNWQQWSDKQLEFTFIPGNEHSMGRSQQGHKPSSWCAISPALPFLLTSGLTLEKSLLGNFGCQPHCVSVKGVIFFCTQTMESQEQAGIWAWRQLDLNPLTHRPYLSCRQIKKKSRGIVRVDKSEHHQFGLE